MIHGRYLPCNHMAIHLSKILEITEQRRTMYLAEFQTFVLVNFIMGVF